MMFISRYIVVFRTCCKFLLGVTLATAYTQASFGADTRPIELSSAFQNDQPGILEINSSKDVTFVRERLRTYMGETWKDTPRFKELSRSPVDRLLGASAPTLIQIDPGSFDGAIPRAGGISGEIITVTFTGTTSLSQVTTIDRRIRFADLAPPSISDILQSLFTTYGAPTRVSGMTVFYAFKAKGVVLPPKAYTPETALEALEMPPANAGTSSVIRSVDVAKCMKIARSESVEQDYSGHPVNAHNDATCDGALFFEFVRAKGDRSRAASLHAKMIDLARRHAEATHQGILEFEIRKERSQPVAKSPPPKL